MLHDMENKSTPDLIQDFVDEKLGSPERESKFGFHVIQGFNFNKAEWFMKYVLGWRPRHPGKALTFGSTIHACREFWYKHGLVNGMGPEELKKVFVGIHNGSAGAYENPSDFADDAQRGLLMLDSWAEATVNDLARFEIIEIEKIHNFELANGFPMTIKLDDLRRDRDSGLWIIGEAKTTSWSIDQMFNSVEVKDQATQYILGISRVLDLDPDRVFVMPDIMYSRGKQARSSRPGLIGRSANELKLYEAETIGLMMDLYTRIKAWRSGIMPGILFPRNGDAWALFGSIYAKIPRDVWGLARPDAIPKPPEGFEVDPRVQAGLIDEFIETWERTQRDQTLEGGFQWMTTPN